MGEGIVRVFARLLSGILTAPQKVAGVGLMDQPVPAVRKLASTMPKRLLKIGNSLSNKSHLVYRGSCVRDGVMGNR